MSKIIAEFSPISQRSGVVVLTRNLSKAHETRESLYHFQFSSYSFENRISLGLGPSGP